MNGAANCLYAICCPPDSPQQISALAEEINKALGPNLRGERGEGAAYGVAAWIIKNFDLAPKGSLQTFKDEVARLARENP